MRTVAFYVRPSHSRAGVGDTATTTLTHSNDTHLVSTSHPTRMHAPAHQTCGCTLLFLFLFSRLHPVSEFSVFWQVPNKANKVGKRQREGKNESSFKLNSHPRWVAELKLPENIFCCVMTYHKQHQEYYSLFFMLEQYPPSHPIPTSLQTALVPGN